LRQLRSSALKLSTSYVGPEAERPLRFTKHQERTFRLCMLLQLLGVGGGVSLPKVPG
jgi:hypothetical protein